MLNLPADMEAEYATFWDALDISVQNVDEDFIELLDRKNDNRRVMYFPHSVYEYLTVNFMEEYGSTRPEVIRQSILQEDGWTG